MKIYVKEIEKEFQSEWTRQVLTLLLQERQTLEKKLQEAEGELEK